MDDKLYAKVKNGQILEVGPIPGFVIHEDGSSTSGFNFMSESEWRKAGYVPVVDKTVAPADPNTHELADQPTYTVKTDRVEMKRAIKKRQVELAKENRAFKAELDQRHADILLLRKEIDNILEQIRIVPDIDLGALDARGLLQVVRAQRQEMLATFDELRSRIDKLEGK